jgi:hypothetical protein
MVSVKEHIQDCYYNPCNKSCPTCTFYKIEDKECGLDLIPVDFLKKKKGNARNCGSWLRLMRE